MKSNRWKFIRWIPSSSQNMHQIGYWNRWIKVIHELLWVNQNVLYRSQQSHIRIGNWRIMGWSLIQVSWNKTIIMSKHNREQKLLISYFLKIYLMFYSFNKKVLHRRILIMHWSTHTSFGRAQMFTSMQWISTIQ